MFYVAVCALRPFLMVLWIDICSFFIILKFLALLIYFKILSIWKYKLLLFDFYVQDWRSIVQSKVFFIWQTLVLQFTYC